MILVVDDHTGLGQGIRMMLEQAGFPATYVDSGEAALAVVREQRPRLIVLDQNMPGLTGIEVLRHLRSDPGLRDIPVIMNSAAINPATEREANRLGVSGYLAKGTDDWDALISLVGECVEGACGRSPASGSQR